MMPRDTLFEYRAWPTAGMPHIEALHTLFGLGVAEMRIDTYILAPSRPKWLMILRGGNQFEIKMKTGVHEPVSAWTTLMQSAFPLRRSVVRALQEAFPDAKLPNRIAAPVDLLSWLVQSASICTVSKRMVQFERGNCTAELSQIEAHGQRAETFCLTAKRYEPVVDILGMLPGLRLPNLDYGSWLHRQVLGAAPAPHEESVRKVERAASWREAFLTVPVALKAPLSVVRR